MNKIWIIAIRELKSFFDSLTAYILIVVFLALSGFFTWLFGSDIFFIGQATLQPFFSVAYWTLFLIDNFLMVEDKAYSIAEPG